MSSLPRILEPREAGAEMRSLRELMSELREFYAWADAQGSDHCRLAWQQVQGSC
jgi:hypothetical protein